MPMYIYTLLILAGLAAASNSGQGTFYDATGALGSCGYSFSSLTVKGEMYIAAVAPGTRRCGSCVRVQGRSGSVVLKVADSCMGCAPTDVDIAQPVFKYVAPYDDGRTPITWDWVSCAQLGAVTTGPAAAAAAPVTSTRTAAKPAVATLVKSPTQTTAATETATAKKSAGKIPKSSSSTASSASHSLERTLGLATALTAAALLWAGI